MMELFELELFGGKTEKRYRKMRPDVEAMPWGTLNIEGYSPILIEAARRSWTSAAFQEFSTAAACAGATEALIQARAPIDLTAISARFAIDEMVHVELCARIAEELGGGVEWPYNPKRLYDNPGINCEPLMKAAHLVVSVFCIGESYSIPLIHNTSLVVKQDLMKAVLKRIVQDEADHGAFGWNFLDWVNDHITDDDRIELGRTADRFITAIYNSWLGLKIESSFSVEESHALGWMGVEEYLVIAERTINKQVLEPLQANGIPVSVVKSDEVIERLMGRAGTL